MEGDVPGGGCAWRGLCLGRMYLEEDVPWRGRRPRNPLPASLATPSSKALLAGPKPGVGGGDTMHRVGPAGGQWARSWAGGGSLTPCKTDLSTPWPSPPEESTGFMSSCRDPREPPGQVRGRRQQPQRRPGADTGAPGLKGFGFYSADRAVRWRPPGVLGATGWASHGEPRGGDRYPRGAPGRAPGDGWVLGSLVAPPTRSASPRRPTPAALSLPFPSPSSPWGPRAQHPGTAPRPTLGTQDATQWLQAAAGGRCQA